MPRLALFINNIEELFANICSNFHVVCRIESGDVCFLGFLQFGEVVECMGYAMHGKLSGFFQSLGVWWNSIVK